MTIYIAVFMQECQLVDTNCFDTREEAEEWLLTFVSNFLNKNFKSYNEMVHWYEIFQNTPISLWTDEMELEYGADDPGFIYIIEKNKNNN
jgi:hypothetical protein